MREMTPERESALDHLLDPEMWGSAGFRGENVDYIECPPIERVERARAELRALREQNAALVADLRQAITRPVGANVAWLSKTSLIALYGSPATPAAKETEDAR